MIYLTVAVGVVALEVAVLLLMLRVAIMEVRAMRSAPGLPVPEMVLLALVAGAAICRAGSIYTRSGVAQPGPGA